MRLEVGPEQVAVSADAPAVVVAQVFNTDDVINAYAIRIFGVDADWVTLSDDRLSLFPGAAGAVTVLVTVPTGYPAGVLRLGVEVTPLVDPSQRQLREVSLEVPAVRLARMSVDPLTTVAGGKATFNLTVSNHGNTPFPLAFEYLDAEAKVKTAFDPPSVVLEPGEQRVVPARTKARRPIVGAPAARQLTLTATGADNQLESLITFVQRPLLGRGLISMFGLLMAISVFAIVLTNTFGRVVDASAVDEAVLKRAIEGVPTERGAPADPGFVTGRVTLLSSGAGAAGVTVELFAADAGDAPVASAATDAQGAYRFADLHEGAYKVRFRGAGFVELWYDEGTTFDEAAEFEVKLGEVTDGIDMVIGGVPGSIAGVVLGDAEGAVVALQVPAASLGSASDAEVMKAEVDAEGLFLLEAVPAPASYELVVTKEGFATARRVVNLQAAQELENVEIRLKRGDGLISGVVTADGELTGGVEVKASNTTDEVSTISLTSGDVGGFTLRNLPTPATYTITFTKEGFATENLTIDLGAGQEVTGLSVALATGTGSISGTVNLAGEGPAGGIDVTVTNTETTLKTQTLSVGDVGSFLVSGLPLPGTYTVTFSGNGLATQVRSIDLDPRSGANAEGVDATLTTSTAVVSGTVRDPNGPAAGVSVSLTDGGGITRTAVSANDPLGSYLLGGVPPGTYTITFRRPGAVPKSVLLTLSAGDQRTVDVQLDPQASISGVVSRSTGNGATAPLSGAEVIVYVADQFPTVVAARVITGGDGTYVLPDLAAPEQYIVEFAFPEGSLPQKSLTVTLNAGEQRTGVNATLLLPGTSTSTSTTAA